MKGKSLIIWIILLNVFDCSVCLTTVWLRKLLLDPDTPLFCSPHAQWKLRLKVRQPHKSGSCRDIWRKAEVKLCSGQTLTFDILLTTERCSVLSSSPMMLSLYLFERQPVGLELKKRFIFRLPGYIHLNTTRTIMQMNETDGTSVVVGYENGPRKLLQADNGLNKNIGHADSTNVLLPKQPGLFEIVVRRSKRHADDIFREEDLRKSAVLKRNSKLPLSASKSDLTQFELLRETTKLNQMLLQAALSNDIVKTNSTIDRRAMFVSGHSLNNSNLANSRLRTQGKGKSKSRNAENASIPQNDPYSSETLMSTKYARSASPISFRSVSTDNKINLIASYTSTKPNSTWNTITRLPVTESSAQAELTSKQEKVTSLSNTKKIMSSYHTVNLTMKPFRTSPANGFLIRTSGAPELFPLPTTDTSTHIIRTTDLLSKTNQNLITDHETTKSKDIISTLRTSKANTNIATTVFTELESTASSFGFTSETKTRSPQQQISSETNPTSNEKNTGNQRSTIITFSSQTPKTTPSSSTTTATSKATSSSTTTQLPTTTTTQLPTTTTTTTTNRATTITTAKPTTTQLPTTTTTTTQLPTTTTTTTTTITTAAPTTKTTPTTIKTTPPTTTITTAAPTTKTTPTTIKTTPPTTTTPSITTTRLLTSMTPKARTTTKRIARTTLRASTGSNSLSASVTTSTVTKLWENVTNSSAPTNTSSNSTLGNETTTSVLHRTEKNVIQEDDTYFWPVVLSLVIGIPAIIVFTIAMVVIMRKRNIDSSTFFMSPPIGDEEV